MKKESVTKVFAMWLTWALLLGRILKSDSLESGGWFQEKMVTRFTSYLGIVENPCWVAMPIQTRDG